MEREEILHREFYQHLKEMRIQQNVSRIKACGESKIDTADMCNYECGKKKPSLDRLLTIGDNMDCDLRFVPRVKK